MGQGKGSGKSTLFLDVLLQNGLILYAGISGKVSIDGEDILGGEIDEVQLKAAVGDGRSDSPASFYIR